MQPDQKTEPPIPPAFRSTTYVYTLLQLLRYDWSDRCTARESLRHPYFREIREVDLRKVSNLRPQVLPVLCTEGVYIGYVVASIMTVFEIESE